MHTAVTFSSEQFRPVLPEESQVNPGRYGAELAFWLCTRLAEEGIVTSYPEYEDWGWFVEYITSDGDEFWLACGNVDGTQDRWHCFLQPTKKGLFGRKGDIEKAKPLIDAVRRVLDAASSVHTIEWETA